MNIQCKSFEIIYQNASFILLAFTLHMQIKPIRESDGLLYFVNWTSHAFTNCSLDHNHNLKPKDRTTTSHSHSALNYIPSRGLTLTVLQMEIGNLEQLVLYHHNTLISSAFSIVCFQQHRKCACLSESKQVSFFINSLNK